MTSIDQAWQAYTDLEARYARAHDLRHQVCPLSQIKPQRPPHKPQGCTLFDVSGKLAGTRGRSVKDTGLTLASQYGGAQRKSVA